jgi:transmembrane sensor
MESVKRMPTPKKTEMIAAAWVARIDRGLSAAEERKLTRWIDADTRHRGAFMRLYAVSLHTEHARALGPHYDPDLFALTERREKKLRRLRRWSFSAAAATAVCVAIVLGLEFLGGAKNYQTQRGQMRVVSLADASVMTLNTDSYAKVDFSADARQVRLVEGEALFDVAKDTARPFVVIAGDTSVYALGTSFAVRHLSSQAVDVIVRDGVVEVQHPTLAPLRVAANMRALFLEGSSPRASKPVPMLPAAMDRELAWINGRIAFEAQTLTEAASAFGRYSPTRIVIDDPAVAGMEITGLFVADDPVSFSRAAAITLGLQVEIRQGEVHLKR